MHTCNTHTHTRTLVFLTGNVLYSRHYRENEQKLSDLAVKATAASQAKSTFLAVMSHEVCVCVCVCARESGFKACRSFTCIQCNAHVLARDVQSCFRFFLRKAGKY